LAEEKEMIVKLKKAFLMVAGAAVQKFGAELEAHQQLLMAAADMLIEIYMAESAVLRTEKMAKKLGADKILVISNEKNRWYIELYRNIVSIFKGKNFRRNYLKYKNLEKIDYKNDENVLSITPKEKLQTWLLSGEKSKLTNSFNQGVKDVLNNEILKDFLACKKESQNV
jgi:hypothetical protein